jgi:hypothetical protein
VFTYVSCSSDRFLEEMVPNSGLWGQFPTSCLLTRSVKYGPLVTRDRSQLG